MSLHSLDRLSTVANHCWAGMQARPSPTCQDDMQAQCQSVLLRGHLPHMSEACSSQHRPLLRSHPTALTACWVSDWQEHGRGITISPHGVATAAPICTAVIIELARHIVIVHYIATSVQGGTCLRTQEPPQASQHSLVEAQPAQHQQMKTREMVTEVPHDHMTVTLAKIGAGWTIWPSSHDGNTSSFIRVFVLHDVPCC